MDNKLETAFQDMYKQLPNVMSAFMGLHDEAAGEGCLSAKVKKLLMIAVSVAIRCEPCIRTHVRTAKALGSSRNEILEAAGVAILMGGAPSAAYCATCLLDELNHIVEDNVNI